MEIKIRIDTVKYGGPRARSQFDTPKPDACEARSVETEMFGRRELLDECCWTERVRSTDYFQVWPRQQAHLGKGLIGDHTHEPRYF